MHTTGERGQDMALNAIQAALHELPRMDHRHRLEHAGNYFATPERMERVKSLGAIPVPNPQFIHSFGFLMEHFYGERIKKGLFPYKMLLDMGFKLPFSSDSTGTQPEATNPFWGIWCAVARESYDGTVMAPEEKISVMDAIRCYTINSAYAGFEENIKGSIEPCKLADLIVVSEDPLSVEIDRIKDITVEMTIIDGKIEYEKRAS
jgi:predicted amidohydrolase YtcJ